MKINLLVNLNGSLIGLSYGSQTEVTVGRELGCTIAPLSSEGLSRRHAKLYAKGDTWYVEDLGSMNGTFHAAKKIEGPVALAARDKLQFGRFELTVDEFTEEVATPVAAVPPVATPIPEVAKVEEVKPVAEVAKPVEPTPAPVAEVAKAEVAKVEEVKPVEPEPAPTPAPVVEVAKPAEAVSPISPVAKPLAPGAKPLIRKPVIGGGAMKPGLKLPPKPGLGAGLKLPPKPAIGGGAMKPGLKLPPKPGFGAGLKLPPKKPLMGAVAKAPVAPVVAELEPVADLTPLNPNE